MRIRTVKRITDYIRRYRKVDRLSLIKENDRQWQIINLGSTQFLYALDFASMPEIQGCNLAFEVQPFYLCLRLLKVYLSFGKGHRPQYSL